MQPTYLYDFQRIPARFSLEQARAARNLVELRILLHGRAVEHGSPLPALDRQVLERRVQRFAAAASAIDTRGTEVEDYVLDLPSDRERLALFGRASPPDIERRMEFYRARAEERLEQFYPAASALPDHLIHVTCTGYVAPSPAQVAAARSGRTQVTHAYHMGCYASLPAIRIGRGLARAGRPAHIVHTELCSLHFNPMTVEAEQLVVQSLFADGHIKYSVGTEAPARGLEICVLHEKVLPDSRDRMTWTIGAQQFNMTLSREVPTSITPHLRAFVRDLLREAGVGAGSSFVYAVHPGGPRIIDEVARTLELESSQTAESREILRRHGNMSSATLPHIWEEILDNSARADGDVVVSLAFGPGLTVSGGVFRICRA